MNLKKEMTQTSSSDLLDLEFCRITKALANHHVNHGLATRPFDSEDLPYFSQVPSEIKKLILHGLEENLNLFDEMTTEKESLNDSPRLLWRSLKRLGWHPTSDIFDKIEKDDVIEIYTAEKHQIFRNLAFFDFISLTLEELVSLPLGVAIEFDPIVLKYINTVAQRIVDQTIRETERSTLPAYIIQEKMGSKFRVEIQQKWLSPVFRDGRSVGVICIHRPRMIS